MSCGGTDRRIRSEIIHSLDLEAKSSHARLVLLNCGFALLLGVVRLGEEHTVVAGGLFGFADAARLLKSELVVCAG